MKSPIDNVIEKSPKYSEHSNVPFRIPKSKLIFIVCDPERRVISNFLEYKSKGRLPNSINLI